MNVTCEWREARAVAVAARDLARIAVDVLLEIGEGIGHVFRGAALASRELGGALAKRGQHPRPLRAERLALALARGAPHEDALGDRRAECAPGLVQVDLD